MQLRIVLCVSHTNIYLSLVFFFVSLAQCLMCILKELLLLAANSELCLYSQATAKTDIQVVSILETQIRTVLSGIQVTTDRSQCILRVSERGHVIDQLFGITHLKIPTIPLLCFQRDCDTH